MRSETKVGLMFIVTIAMVITFSYYLGVLNLFSQKNELTIAYNFAGGIEVGSPVRVMGIKVGKVKEIKFDPQFKMPNGEEVKLKVVISVNEKAWTSLRQDSKFYINLAGVIGEKYLEVSPGSLSSGELEPNSILRGVDPPRIDQLISQGYGLAGKILEMVENNEGSVVETLNTVNLLVVNLNSLLKQTNALAKHKEAREILKNITTLTSDLAYFTGNLRDKEGKKTLKLLNKLIWRLEALDGPQIKKFLQEEGIKAKLF
ncbi:MAG: MCE family protein [Bdellovibrionaceae bacterium]|jgi:phospholipid/cholesterol/gamma-HCH transport system substrate-binding protein|nr:MCE family protein [Pseudobdellovibrionaceae bacterium]